MHLHNLRALAAACADKSSACDASQIGPGERVALGAAGSFDVHYDWLSRALESAKTLADADRAKLMRSVEAHLDAGILRSQRRYRGKLGIVGLLLGRGRAARHDERRHNRRREESQTGHRAETIRPSRLRTMRAWTE